MTSCRSRSRSRSRIPLSLNGATDDYDSFLLRTKHGRLITSRIWYPPTPSPVSTNPTQANQAHPHPFAASDLRVFLPDDVVVATPITSGLDSLASTRATDAALDLLPLVFAAPFFAVVGNDAERGLMDRSSAPRTSGFTKMGSPKAPHTVDEDGEAMREFRRP